MSNVCGRCDAPNPKSEPYCMRCGSMLGGEHDPDPEPARHPASMRSRRRRAGYVAAAIATVVLAAVASAHVLGGGPRVDSVPTAAGARETSPRPVAATDAGRGATEQEPAGSDLNPTAAPDSTTSSTPMALAALDDLLVVDTDLSIKDYRRKDFGDGWNYDPSTGCNTRELVLIAESVVAPEVDERCHPISGRWVSIYDGATTTDPADLEIDHVVPLADAWRSGASRWSPEQRRAFANDVSNPNALVAVSSSSNRSKSDSTPDQWLPTDRSAWCSYAMNWVEVKKHWKLTVTSAEKSTLVGILVRC